MSGVDTRRQQVDSIRMCMKYGQRGSRNDVANGINGLDAGEKNEVQHRDT
jgi:hypothetical protein